MTVVCEQELKDYPEFEALSSKMTVVWAGGGEPSVRWQAYTKVRH